MSRNTAPFSDELYLLWCQTWLQLVENHSQRLVNCLLHQKHDSVAASIRVAKGQLLATLQDVVRTLESGACDDTPLLQGYGCLKELEAHHQTDPRRHMAALPEVRVAGQRYLLLPPLRQTTRCNASFKLSSELAIPGTLMLGYRWVQIEADDILDWKPEAALEMLLSSPRLRVGLAPCAIPVQMAWSIDARDLRGPDGKAPLRCLGANDTPSLWVSIEAILAAAYREEVQLLLLPELVLDEALLARCQQWLETHNLPAPRLRLVVAGSRHCDTAEGFANRCTVLGQDGAMLWEQDKRSPFVIDNAGMLEQLSPGCAAASAFEPTVLGQRVVVRDSAAGRLLTPICLDFIEGALWSELGADLYLVPAMTPGLARFHARARAMGNLHGAASFVCNAQTEGKHQYVAYRPINLERAVGRGGECVCGGAGQGATTRNSGSIPRSCNVAMRHRRRAIRSVASFTEQVSDLIEVYAFLFKLSPEEWSGQLLFLGLRML